MIPENSKESVDLNILFSSLWNIPVLIFAAIVKGGFSEEIWRVFVLTRFQKVFGKIGIIVALILGSITFGIHLNHWILLCISVFKKKIDLGSNNRSCMV
jgi:membrane protease YdiL (CAAX protease family)